MELLYLFLSLNDLLDERRNNLLRNLAHTFECLISLLFCLGKFLLQFVDLLCRLSDELAVILLQLLVILCDLLSLEVEIILCSLDDPVDDRVFALKLIHLVDQVAALCRNWSGALGLQL